MPTYNILNTVSGAHLGGYTADTRDAALDAYARDAGYADYAAAREVAGDDGIKVVEVEIEAPSAVRIQVDEENSGEAWWDAARAAIATCPARCCKLLVDMGVDEIEVSPEVADAFEAWAKSLPGWSDPEAPEYAPHPLQFHR